MRAATRRDATRDAARSKNAKCVVRTGGRMSKKRQTSTPKTTPGRRCGVWAVWPAGACARSAATRAGQSGAPGVVEAGPRRFCPPTSWAETSTKRVPPLARIAIFVANQGGPHACVGALPRPAVHSRGAPEHAVHALRCRCRHKSTETATPWAARGDALVGHANRDPNGGTSLVLVSAQEVGGQNRRGPATTTPGAPLCPARVAARCAQDPTGPTAHTPTAGALVVFRG